MGRRIKLFPFGIKMHFFIKICDFYPDREYFCNIAKSPKNK